MEDDPDRRRSAKERRQERDHGKRAARSALVRSDVAHLYSLPQSPRMTFLCCGPPWCCCQAKAGLQTVICHAVGPRAACRAQQDGTTNRIC